MICTVRAWSVFGRHHFFCTSGHYGKAHGNLFSGWMNYNYTACCWFPTSSNILILPSQFWKIRFESCWLHCSKCRILVLLRYMVCIYCLEEVHTYKLHVNDNIFPKCNISTLWIFKPYLQPLTVIGELTDESYRRKLVEETLDKYGKLDILVSK